MTNLTIFEELVDPKISRILQVLLKNKEEQFHLKKISNESKVPLATTFRIVQKLVNLNVLTQVKIDKFKLYRLADNKKTKQLASMVKKREESK